MQSIWFGYNNSEGFKNQNYFLPLGYEGMPMKATVALNFQGLGLPTYLWEDFANLLSRTAHIVQSDLFISRSTGIFYLNGNCKNTDYDDLWHYYFKV
jgi:hypothetical protein